MRLTSPADASVPSASAALGAAAKLRVLAAAATAAALVKVRRVMESLAISPPLAGFFTRGAFGVLGMCFLYQPGRSPAISLTHFMVVMIL
jgi:hypothetical protein